MNASTLPAQAGPAWIARARNWLSGRARLRRDAGEVARMDARELRDLGLSHAAAFGGAIRMTGCGPVAHGNWMRAQPRFPGRAIRHD